MCKIQTFLTIACYIVLVTTSVVAQEQPKRPSDFKPFHYKYSTLELYEKFSADMMKRAADDVKKLIEVNEKGKYKPNPESLANHKIPDWFRDAKLGIFFDWGPWSVPGYAVPRDPNLGTGGSYPDWYEFLMDYSYKSYHDTVWGPDFRRDDFLPLLTGEQLNADEYADLAVRSGAKYFVPFSRHHAGWTMWESSYTFRNAKEMGPKRDIKMELAQAVRKRGLKFALYFSIAEWEYPVIVDKRISQWDPTPNLAIFHDGMAILPRPIPYASYFPAVHDRMISGKIPVRDYYADYMMPLFKEAVDKFDPDIVWYDGGWGVPVSVSRAAELSAYFYNQAEGRKEVVINNRAGSALSAEEMAELRRLRESGDHDAATERTLRNRQLGDYTTPEYHIGKIDPSINWEVCRSISPAFGYNWTDNESNSLSSFELIKMFIEIVSGNGNLLLVINPDGKGKLSEIQRKRLLDLGDWLRINGEGIYSTRPWVKQVDGNQYFTQSKDGKYIYVHFVELPGESAVIKDLTALKGSKASLLGYKGQLKWNQSGSNLELNFPESLRNEFSKTSPYAWVLKIQVKK
ncbi:MAG: alpha-L-fucosidase [Cyclobacteriaceae bacterium]|nr:MAG: alpha-L-fucosidase [Cyclobacteriaceae bacterium]